MAMVSPSVVPSGGDEPQGLDGGTEGQSGGHLPVGILF
jgi:hypothetical protein